MWPLDRLRSTSPQLPSVRQLLVEQNQLLRELIFALTKEPANTRPSQAPQPPRRKLTASDVTRVPLEVYVRQREADLEKQRAPWREDPQSPVPTVAADLPYLHASVPIPIPLETLRLISDPAAASALPAASPTPQT